MAENSKIEWTHATFNPWRGCTQVSPGCAHCYAERMSHRNPAALGEWGDDGARVIAAESYWRQPLKWDRDAAAAGERRRVFCASLADVFEDRPELVAPRVRLFHLISETRWLDWLLLTKRPENIKRFSGGGGVTRSWSESMPPNVWLGVSVEDQQRADERIPLLLETPAAVRFLSCEPLLGPVDLSAFIGGEYMGLGGAVPNHNSGIDWLIAGGESGPHARPMHPAWPRDLRDQCQRAGVPYFFKQWGEWFPSGQFDLDTARPRLDGLAEVYVGRDGQVLATASPFEHGCPCDVPPGFVSMVRTGKKAAGRMLDGREWSEVPLVLDTRP